MAPNAALCGARHTLNHTAAQYAASHTAWRALLLSVYCIASSASCHNLLSAAVKF